MQKIELNEDWIPMQVSLETARTLEEELQLPAGFSKSLLKLDDWTFVVKGWALFESILELLIWSKLDHLPNEFRKVISRIDSGNMKTGKLAFAKSLNLLGPKEWRFLQSLAELRNLVAHGINHIQFDFVGHLAAQDEKIQKEFLKKFESCNCCGVQENLFKKLNNFEQKIQHPREYVMTGYFDVLHCLSLKLEHKAIRQLKAEINNMLEEHIADSYREFNEEWFKKNKKADNNDRS